MGSVAKVRPSLPKDLPAEWPGATKLYRPAKAAMLVNWQIFLMLMVTWSILVLLIGMLAGDKIGTFRWLLAQVLSIPLSVSVACASTFIQLQDVARHKVSVAEMMRIVRTRFWPLLGAQLLCGLILLGGLLLFIIPGILVMPRLMLVPYWVVNQKLQPLAAIRASWAATKGHASKVWALLGMNLVFAAISITIIGIPVSIYLLFMYIAAAALLYRWLAWKKSTEQASKQQLG